MEPSAAAVVRGQRRLGHGDAGRHRHLAARPADQGRRNSARDGRDTGRPDRLRRELGDRQCDRHHDQHDAGEALGHLAHAS